MFYYGLEINVFQGDTGVNKERLKEVEKFNVRMRSPGNKWRSKFPCFPFETLRQGRENRNISRLNPILSGREVDAGVHTLLVEDEGRISDWNWNKLQASSQEGKDLFRSPVLNFCVLWLTELKR